ncbi:GNAT family N-acetyltransferase [Massilia sp. IC2-476]|uniref:GNAT family N-acetyltransferase n=1 Tax=Massilia sp. IC2-476 TaxID=2887199 RepID=UPI001D0FFF21|nr:GNAT family N-acetyltransferase [Massilia sp. IC2-476]MCC2970752.1 GNAT family N-acetyltransferase [Massilia sp. IC2-476]
MSDAALIHGQGRFRRARRADIPAMSAIRLSVRENVLSDPTRVTLQMYEDYLERDGHGWVAEVDGMVAGFCYADRSRASIWALFVSPGHEGLGLGQGLLGLAVSWLFELGHQRISLTTTPGTRADRFYAAQGWTRLPEGGTEVGYVLERAASPLSQLAGSMRSA